MFVLVLFYRYDKVSASLWIQCSRILLSEGYNWHMYTYRLSTHHPQLTKCCISVNRLWQAQGSFGVLGLEIVAECSSGLLCSAGAGPPIAWSGMACQTTDHVPCALRKRKPLSTSYFIVLSPRRSGLRVWGDSGAAGGDSPAPRLGHYELVAALQEAHWEKKAEGVSLPGDSSGLVALVAAEHVRLQE
jgi:hypothetical protein